MKNLKINNIFFNKLSQQKYNLTKRLYPETIKIFNQDNYDLPFIESDCAHKYLIDKKKNYIRHNKSIEILYQELLNKLALLITKIKNNPNLDEIMYIYAYIYYNGYLSNNQNFKFINPYNELEYRRGLTITTGEGVCRNIGDMFNDLLKAFKKQSIGIITDRSNYKECNYLIHEYYQFVNNNNSHIEDEIVNIDNQYQNIERGNHFVVLVLKDEYYLLDPTRLCSYSITDEDTGYPALDYLCLWSLYALGEYNIKNTVALYKSLENKYLDMHNNYKDINIQKNCYKKCEKNKKKIISFYNETKKHRKLIKQFLDNN